MSSNIILWTQLTAAAVQIALLNFYIWKFIQAIRGIRFFFQIKDSPITHHGAQGTIEITADRIETTNAAAIQMTEDQTTLTAKNKS